MTRLFATLPDCHRTANHKGTGCPLYHNNTFYDFPAAHWSHIRTAGPIESTYATVRHRTKRTKGCGSRAATLTMVWKLAMEAQKTWRRLMGYKHITLVIEGRRFVDGALKEKEVA